MCDVRLRVLRFLGNPCQKYYLICRIQILTFGLGTIGAVFSFSIASYQSGGAENSNYLAIFVLILVIPLITNFLLILLIGEYESINELGRFITEIENKINQRAPQDLQGELHLGWENYIRTNRVYKKYPYTYSLTLLLVISFTSGVLGLTLSNFYTNFKLLIGVIEFIYHFVMWKILVNRASKM